MQIELGKYQEWKGSGHARKSYNKVDTMMYVPILHTIEQLLQSHTITSEVCACYTAR